MQPLESRGSGLTDHPVKISICVDSDVFARGLVSMAEEIPEAPACIQAHNPKQVTQAIRNGIDILILDQNLADEVGPALSESRSQPRILLVSERDHVGVGQSEQLQRACGFFPARASELQLKHFLQTLLNCQRKKPCETLCRDCPLFGSRQPRGIPLTQRETEIFGLIGQLYTNSEIAEQLDISIKTVEAHCANIKTKLELNSARALLKAAIDWVEGR